MQKFGGAVPILRIFDVEKARDFYLSFLGFSVDWEHRFGDNFPLYMQISEGGCVLHLTEHHGDCCPGSAMRIAVDAIDELHAELTAKQFKYARPGLDDTPWGTRDLSVKDPFGNRLTFTTAIST